MAEDLKPMVFENKLGPVQAYFAAIPFISLLVTSSILYSLPLLKGEKNPFYQNPVVIVAFIGAGALMSLAIWMTFLKNNPKKISVGADGCTFDYGKGRLSFVQYEQVVGVKVFPNTGLFKQEGGRGQIVLTNAIANRARSSILVSGLIAKKVEIRRAAFMQKVKRQVDNPPPSLTSNPDVKRSRPLEQPHERMPPVIISKGKATHATLITFLAMPFITLVVILYALRSGALWGTIDMVIFALLSFYMLRKLTALTKEVTVKTEGLALYDAQSLVFFSIGTPKSVPISRGEISLIRVADTLERKAFRRKVMGGRSDMVVSTKAGKDYFLMKRPTDELIRAAWLLGFPQGRFSPIDQEDFVPRTYQNTVDRVTEQRAYPIIAMFIFLVFSFLSWTIHVLRSIWILAIIDTLFFLMIPMILYIAVRTISRSSLRNPRQVSVGNSGLTLTFKNGKNHYVDFNDLEAIFTIFRSSLIDDGLSLKRGLFRVRRGQIVSISPEIVLAIREAYRTNKGYYPTVSTF